MRNYHRPHVSSHATKYVSTNEISSFHDGPSLVRYGVSDRPASHERLFNFDVIKTPPTTMPASDEDHHNPSPHSFRRLPSTTLTQHARQPLSLHLRCFTYLSPPTTGVSLPPCMTLKTSISKQKASTHLHFYFIDVYPSNRLQ